MNSYKAFLFDLNGTMIDDMHYHIEAWYNILQNLGAVITLQQTAEQCYGKNDELLERIFPGRFSAEEKSAIGLQKEKQYQLEYKPRLALINGLENFIQHYHAQGIKMAIGSAAIMYNINFVLDGLNIRHYFDAIVSADDVMLSKPNAETYTKAADKLNVLPEHCVVFEDNPKGVQSAINAGMHSIVVTTMHKPNDFDGLENILAFRNDFVDLTLY